MWLVVMGNRWAPFSFFFKYLSILFNLLKIAWKAYFESKGGLVWSTLDPSCSCPPTVALPGYRGSLFTGGGKNLGSILKQKGWEGQIIHSLGISQVDRGLYITPGPGLH